MRLFRSLLWLAILAVCAYAFVPFLEGWMREWIGIPVMFGTCVVLPGYALWRFTRPLGDDAIESITRVLLNGLIFLFVLCFAWALTHVSLDAFRAALPLLIIAMCAAVPPRDRTRIEVVKPRLRGYEKHLLILFAVLAVMPAVGLAITGPPLAITSDTIDHAGYVAEIARTGHPFPSTAIYLAPGVDGQDFRKGLLHAVYGLFTRHTGASPLDVFAVVGSFLLLTMTFTVYTFSRSVLRHRVAAVVAGVFFLAGSDWGIGSDMVRAAFYPNRFGAAFLLMFISYAIEFVHRGPKSALRWCAVFAFAAGVVHIEFAVACSAAAGVILLWKTCSPCKGWDEHLSRSLRVLLAAIAGALPFTLYRILTAYQTNPLHNQVQDAVFITPHWFAADPVQVWRNLGPLGIAALFCIKPLWGRRQNVPGVGYAIAALLTYLAIEFIPFILTPLYAVLKYLVFRLDVMVPVYMLPAFFVVSWKPHGARVTKAVIVLMVLAIVIPIMHQNAFTPSVVAAERRQGPDRWARGLYQLAELLPPGSVIASDPVTSYLISAFTPHYVVCTLDQHAPPNDLRVEGRMTAARDIVSPYTSARDKDRMIRANHVTHVVINRSLPQGLILNYWTLDPNDAQDADDMFRSLKYEFEAKDLDDGITAFRWRNEERLSTLPRPVPRPVVDALPAEATPVGEMAGEVMLDAATIRGAGILPPGGELEMDLYWSRRSVLPPGTYVVSIRFDRKVLSLPFNGEPFPKITRKVMEKIRHERYRFRSDHMIFGGLFGPDAWTMEDIVEDNVHVKLPTDLAPGRYRVEAKMLRIANQPNHELRDYFYDDDVYQGVRIGEVTIEAWDGH
ncbi:MAG TPA: hypothetical protein VJS69_11230 [Candidatus Krumholzibacteria bacterium]|nr:hypothetical protein [Candidatus Krumholzibacteria bacterium]